MAKRLRCTAVASCFEPVVQRVLVPNVKVVHRCMKHHVDYDEAEENGWELFDV